MSSLVLENFLGQKAQEVTMTGRCGKGQRVVMLRTCLCGCLDARQTEGDGLADQVRAGIGALKMDENESGKVLTGS